MEINVDILKQTASVSKGHEIASFEDHLFNFALELIKRGLGPYSELFTKVIGSRTELSWPTMPLNTDGIDPSGSNVLIENVNITNYDDAVAVKPSKGNYMVARDGCSQDITVRNANVKFGLGMTIGSVPPSTEHACVRRVHFHDINFEYPIKAIYVKTNPGEGTG